MQYGGAGAVPAPSRLGQKWEQRIACVVLRWDRCAVCRHRFSLVIKFVPFSYNFFPFFFFFVYSLINTGNELHMATAFTSLCEICSSCIVYQFNMFTTDAISAWQLSCLKSPFPTRHVPPQPSHLLSNMHHYNLIPFPGWCHTAAKRANLPEVWPLCGHLNWWKVLKYYCIFTPTKGKLNWPPRVQMMENQTQSLLHEANKNWFTSFHLTASGSYTSLEKYCALQTFSSIMTSEMYMLYQCYWTGLWNNLWTTSIRQNTQRGHDLLRP